ncbi:MAG: MFS transporter [Candidatus Bathyarchaeia archaeon]|nr:MFS transporter [Candidatus Bathyarchaeota archaeon]
MRNLIMLNVFDAFISGAYMLIIPLLLIERNISLSTIGFIFSIFPVVFLISRLIFASAADVIGFKKFFNINGLGNFTSAIFYAISSSPFLYSVAKGLQGLKESSLWAVNRNAAYAMANNKNPQMVTSTLLFIRSLSFAIGALTSGYLLIIASFNWVFVFLIGLSILIFIPANMIDLDSQKRKLTLKILFKNLDLREVNRKVWKTSLNMSFYMAASTITSSFILPIYLNSIGFNYWNIGIILALYNATGALLLPVTLYGKPSIKKVIFIQSILYTPAVISLPFSKKWLVLLIVLIMGLGESLSYITWESLIAQAVKDQSNIATTIAFLHAPSNLIMIPSLIFSGLLTEKFGYIIPFWIASILFILYSIGSWLILKYERTTLT